MKDLLKFAPKTTKVAQAIAEDDKNEREARDVTPDTEEIATNDSSVEPEIIDNQPEEKNDNPFSGVDTGDAPNPFAEKNETSEDVK